MFTRLLPPNAHKHIARHGVDNNPATRAQASNEWAWTYAVDLIQPAPVRRINLAFAKDAFATDYEIAVSLDGLKWKTIHSVHRGNGAPLKLKLKQATHASWIKIKALKPDGDKQPGYQMGITELYVFSN